MTNSLCNRLLAAVFCLLPLTAAAQLTLVQKGKARARIVCTGDTATSHRAARLLNTFLERMSGATLPQTDTTGPYTARKGDIVIGEPTPDAGEDGFQAVSGQGILHIRTGGGSGAVNGIVALLERYLDAHYYAYKAWTVVKRKDILLPALQLTETPAFSFRQTQSYGSDDPDFTAWFALESHEQLFAGDLWVHTFNRLLPSRVYGAAHPEWYSLLNGRRQPGDHSQWCLTNDEVFEAACQKIDSVFKAHPGLRTISVSQNDGNNTQCQCAACRAVDEEEGSPSGNLIRFMNRLAKRYPDKEFSTLAYLYSMHPPRKTRPLPNVNIMLCDIDCMREVPLTDNASGQDFMRALTGWSAISDNIFVWDYGINFDNVVSPFPNFHIIQRNLQLFKEHHATKVFEQINSTKGTDLCELRTYMMAKLMWNPYQDADSLMRGFLDGYYGAAAQPLYQYIKIMQGALLASGINLWIYDSPITHKNGMLRPTLLKTYNQLFDEAEAAVADDEELLRRVRIARLPLQYAQLELARTEPQRDVAQVTRLLDLFEQRTADYGIPTLNERHNKPSDYCALYRQRFLPTGRENKAAHATVKWNKAPAQRYRGIADTALTDGLYGGTTFVESWVGWEGEDADFVLDLGTEKTFRSVEIDFLHQLGAWILLPKGGRITYSADGQRYTQLGTFQFAEDRDVSVKFVGGRAESAVPVSARYIRIEVETLGNCPDWHYGVGYPAWFFMDEVVVE